MTGGSCFLRRVESEPCWIGWSQMVLQKASHAYRVNSHPARSPARRWVSHDLGVWLLLELPFYLSGGLDGHAELLGVELVERLSGNNCSIYDVIFHGNSIPPKSCRNSDRSCYPGLRTLRTRTRSNTYGNYWRGDYSDSCKEVIKLW